MTYGPENVPPAQPPAPPPQFIPPQATPPPSAPPPPGGLPPQPTRGTTGQRLAFLIVLGVFAVAAVVVLVLGFLDLSTRESEVAKVKRSTEKPMIRSFPANPCDVVPAATINRLIPSAETIPSPAKPDNQDPAAGCRWLSQTGAPSRQLHIQMTAHQDNTTYSGVHGAERQLASIRRVQQKFNSLQELPALGGQAFATFSTRPTPEGSYSAVMIWYRVGNTQIDISYSASETKNGREVPLPGDEIMADSVTFAQGIARYLSTCATCGG